MEQALRAQLAVFGAVEAVGGTAPTLALQGSKHSFLESKGLFLGEQHKVPAEGPVKHHHALGADQ